MQRRHTHRTHLAVGAAVLVLLAGSAVAATTQPAAGVETRPNVVVFLTDDQPWYTVPTTTGVQPMPYLEARVTDPGDHWIRFTNAFTNTPICCPTRTTLFTGGYSHRTGVETNGAGVADEGATVATWLRAAGYRTGLVGKYVNRWPFGLPYAVPQGWDDWHANFLSYYGYRNYENGNIVQYGNDPADYGTDVIAAKAAAFVDSAPADRPFFLYVAPKAAHDPWVPAPRHEGVFAGMAPVRFSSFNEADASDKPGWVRDRPVLTSQEVTTWDAHRRDAYETLRSADDAVRTIFTALERKGVLDETVFIFLSDNSVGFGEHRWTTKKCELDICTHVPFLVRYPGATARTSAALVSTTDVVATVTDLADATPTAPLDGRSLLPQLTGTATDWRSGVLLHGVDDGYASPGYWAVRTSGALYAELTTGELELYDMAGTVGPPDPHQLVNRAGDPAYAALRTSMAAQLLALRGGAVTRTVSVGTSTLSPTSVSGPAGTTVTWRFGGTRNHRLVDATGVVATGVRAPGSTARATFTAAGTYTYRCTLHPGEPAGTVQISGRAGPSSGGPTTIFVVAWASRRPASGYVADVQVRRPGTTAFVSWKQGTTVASATFVPDRGSGQYQFRSRLRTATGATSGWSPPVAITVR